MKKAEREYLSRVQELGCMICRRPAQIHHVRSGVGMGQRSKHIGGTFPLCPEHHKDGGWGVAFHSGSTEWQKRYGTEQKYLDQVQESLERESLKTIINNCPLPF